MTSFVKSADTSVSAEKSRIEVERVLRRYGARGFSYSQDYVSGKIAVSFVVPNSPVKDAHDVPVQLPIDTRAVYDRLYGRPMMWNGSTRTPVHNPKGYDVRKLEQAERVAWRHLVLWIDAALTAATAGFQTMTEAFFAHTVITDEHGRRGRLADYLDTIGELAPGVRALLATPVEVEA